MTERCLQCDREVSAVLHLDVCGVTECRNFRAVHIFALFTFLKFHENINIFKISYIMSHTGNINKIQS